MLRGIFGRLVATPGGTMPIRFEDLDDATRRHMLAELEHDEKERKLYLSPRLNDDGQRNYVSLLREAVERHDSQWLAAEIERRGYLNSHEERRKPSGGVTLARVPVTAAQTLSDGEFNRFYCRGLCSRATETSSQVQVYRALDVRNPRPESEARIGVRLDPAAVLADLRSSIAIEPAFGVPAGPNSGLSLRLAQ
jgi:hypothetical protein